MKKIWNDPIISELSLDNTGYKITGNSWDIRYIGDGIVNGYLEWELLQAET